MGYTISIHTEGDMMVVGHNRRDDVTLKEQHIDHNGIHETWIDRDIREVYHSLFDESVNAYNEKVKSHGQYDRCIQDYYEHIRNDHKKHVVYESIIQVGNAECQPTEEQCRAILKDYLNDYIKNNPTMVVIGAYYHGDEPNGTPHLHLDQIPVARDCERGMRVQNSHNKAIQQLGIEKGHYKNLAHAFQERERDRLEQICKERGLEIERGVCADKRKHVEKDIYMLTKQRENLINDVKDLELIRTADTLKIKSIEDIAIKQQQLDERDQEFEKRRKAYNQHVREKERQLQQRELAVEEKEQLSIEEQANRAMEHLLAEKYRQLEKQYPDLVKQLEYDRNYKPSDNHDDMEL